MRRPACSHPRRPDHDSYRCAIVGEQVGRGSIYLGALSSALIALGFLAQVVTRLELFVAAVLPALFLAVLLFGVHLQYQQRRVAHLRRRS
jgi:hypothetical protein